MSGFLLKKILSLLLALWVISILLFFLQRAAPGDAVLRLGRAFSGEMYHVHPLAAEAIYRAEAQRRGLNLPAFYISVQPAFFPDTFYRIQYPEALALQRALLLETGDWSKVQAFYGALTRCYSFVAEDPSDRESIFWQQRLSELVRVETLAEARILWKTSVHRLGRYRHQGQAIGNLLDQLAVSRPGVMSWLPTLRWQGWDNQYHRWFRQWLRGDLGVSLRDGRKVGEKLGEALPWTLWINGAAILLAYLFAFPMGIFLALKGRGRLGQLLRNTLLVLYALPSFWVGSMLLLLATSPELGYDFFRVSGWLALKQGGGFWADPFAWMAQLSLPVICMAYGLAAFLAHYLQHSFSAVLQEPFVAFARTRGISGFRLYFGHVLPNALLPQVVFVAELVPTLFSGSVIIEYLFNVPGMGRLLLDSLVSQDWPTVYSFVLLIAFLTAFGLLFSDMLLQWTDPRIRIAASQSPPS